MLHATDLELEHDRLRIRLRGLAAVGALRRRLDVPYRQIRAVSTTPLPSRPIAWRLGGLSVGDRRFGTFRQGGRWLFIAHVDPKRVVRLELEGDGPERVRFAEVVVGARDPDGFAAALRDRVARARA